MNGPLTCEADPRRALVIDAIFDQENPRIANGIDFVEENFVEEKKPKSKIRVTIHLFKAAKSESEFEFTNLMVLLAGGQKYSTDLKLIAEKKADRLDIDRNRVSFDVDASVGPIHGTATLVLKQGVTLRLDERFSKTEFTIRQKKTSATDLIQRPLPVRPSLPEPKIDYLAKDFGSFRKLILDRLSLTMPGWQERREADFGMTIVELLSYVGDQLSYYQDAVATEAYLDTARLRSSVRKHTRLIDYRMHEGCNSRAFVHIEVDRSTGIDMADVMFLTKIDQTEFRDQVSFAMDDLPDEVVADSVVFEPIAIPTSSALSPEQILNWNELRRKTSQLYGWWQLVSASMQEMASVTEDAILCFLNRVIRGSDLKSRKIMDPKDCIRRRVVRNRKMMDRIFGPAIQASRTRDRLSLFAEHNTIQIYDWGNPEYSIPKDSTSVCLVDELPSDKKTRCDEGEPKTRLLTNLQVGDWLAFEEVKGPNTGLDADANPSKRQVVRVTGLERTEDPVNGRLLLKIHWDYLDRLTDSYCVSSTGQVPGCQAIKNVSVARGNIFLMDHGQTSVFEKLGTPDVEYQQIDCATECFAERYESKRTRFRPILEQEHLTYRTRLKELPPESKSTPAALMLRQKPHQATPSVSLIEIPAGLNGTPIPIEPNVLENGTLLLRRMTNWIQRGRNEFLVPLLDRLSSATNAELDAYVGKIQSNKICRESDRQTLEVRLAHELTQALTWVAVPDLIESGPYDRHFVIETGEQRRSQVRFGDGVNGQQPTPGSTYFANYRTGSGIRGNVGAEAIHHVVFRRNFQGTIRAVRNLTPSVGGREPESMARAKLIAPDLASRQERGILGEDYDRLVAREFSDQVQHSKTTIEWQGTRYQVTVAFDALAHVQNKEMLRHSIATHLEKYRRIGHSVSVIPGIEVPLRLLIKVTLNSGVFASDVREELLERFGDREFDDGRLGFFHPDRMTFGQAIEQSHMVSAAKSIPGIADISFEVGPIDGSMGRNYQAGPIEIPKLSTSGCDDCGFIQFEFQGGRK